MFPFAHITSVDNMAFKSKNVSDSVHSNPNLFKCTTCKKFLSVPPIFIDAEGVQTVCGRCEPNSSHWTRQLLYESIAAKWSFPCSNKGCPFVDSWQTITDHEKSCSFQQRKCFLPMCQYDCALQFLGKHLEKDHGVYFKPGKNEFDVNFSDLNSANNYFLIKLNGRNIIAFIVHCKENNISCMAVLINDCNENYDFKIEITSDKKKNNSFILTCDKLITLSSFYDNEMDIKKSCQTKFNFEQIKTLFENPEHIYGRISFNKKVEDQDEAASLILFSDDLLTELECQICMRYFTGEIYICETGHSMCHNCNKKCLLCPVCRSKLKNARNYSLEKLLKNVNFPCSNHNEGCTVRCEPHKLAEHESVCKFSYYATCFICSNKEINLLKHLSMEHRNKEQKVQLFENYLKFNGYYRILGNDSNTLWIHYNGDIFRVIFNLIRERAFCLAIHQLRVSTYMYELEIKSITSNYRLTLSRNCAPVDKDESPLNDCMVIPEELLSSYTSVDGMGRYFAYEIRLIKS